MCTFLCFVFPLFFIHGWKREFLRKKKTPNANSRSDLYKSYPIRITLCPLFNTRYTLRAPYTLPSGVEVIGLGNVMSYRTYSCDNMLFFIRYNFKKMSVMPFMCNNSCLNRALLSLQYALHVASAIPTGVMAVGFGNVMSSVDSFRIELKVPNTVCLCCHHQAARNFPWPAPPSPPGPNVCALSFFL